MAQKVPFSYLKENASLSVAQVFLRLSRACLGKLIVLGIRNGSKKAFSRTVLPSTSTPPAPKSLRVRSAERRPLF